MASFFDWLQSQGGKVTGDARAKYEASQGKTGSTDTKSSERTSRVQESEKLWNPNTSTYKTVPTANVDKYLGMGYTMDGPTKSQIGTIEEAAFGGEQLYTAPDGGTTDVQPELKQPVGPSDTSVGTKTSDFQLTDADYDYSKLPEGVTATRYVDPQGTTKQGYIIGGQTYTDPEGTERVGVGSKVETGGGWFELTEEGGVKIDDPFASAVGIDVEEGSKYVDIPTEEEFMSLYAPEEATVDTVDATAGPGIITDEVEDAYITPEEQQLYDLTSRLTGEYLGYEPTETMGAEEAQARAAAQLGQSYDQALQETMQAYDANAIQRGMFGQMPAEVVKQEAMARVELDRSAAIQDLANDLYMQDFERGQAVDASNLSRMMDNLNVVRAELAQETAKKQEIKAYQDEKTAKAIAAEQAAYERFAKEFERVSEAEKATIEAAYKRWEALGVADAAVESILGVPEGTQSSDNMELQMEYQYKTMLAEYESLLALQKMQQEHGYDVSLAGYKSARELDEIAARRAADIAKAAAAAGYNAAAAIEKLEKEYELKSDYEELKGSIISPEQKVEWLKMAIDKNVYDEDLKDVIIEGVTTKYNTDYENALADENNYDEKTGIYTGPEFDVSGMISEINKSIPGTDMDAVMKDYNAFLNIAGGGGQPVETIDISEDQIDEPSFVIDENDLYDPLYYGQ